MSGLTDPLDSFHPPVREWCRTSFSAPTPAQSEGWNKILARRSTLLLAPTVALCSGDTSSRGRARMARQPPDILITTPQLLLLTAARLMKRNLGGFPRVTRRTPRGERLWVYGRSGRPCRRCETTIRMRRQGDLGRSTYWCPGCQ